MAATLTTKDRGQDGADAGCGDARTLAIVVLKSVAFARLDMISQPFTWARDRTRRCACNTRNNGATVREALTLSTSTVNFYNEQAKNKRDALVEKYNAEAQSETSE